MSDGHTLYRRLLNLRKPVHGQGDSFPDIETGAEIYKKEKIWPKVKKSGKRPVILKAGKPNKEFCQLLLRSLKTTRRRFINMKNDKTALILIVALVIRIW